MTAARRMTLLTGASGFVGGGVLSRLAAADYPVRVALRGPSKMGCLRVPSVTIGELLPCTNWAEALEGVQVVIHAAARVHVMAERATDPLKEFRQANVEGTLQLARQAAQAGAKRFIFISSIKVNGESTERDVPFSIGDFPAPLDPYGISKMEAETGLRSLAAETGMEVVIIRPVLVYGPGVKANFRSMMNWLCMGVPLPLGAIHNKRSLVSLDNLVDLIVTCIDHPAAANQTFLVSDGEDLSTTELLRRMSLALGKPARLLPVPAALLGRAAAMLGKKNVAQRLCGSLQVDISKTRELLGWAPPVSVDQALRMTADHYLAHKG